MSDLDLLKAQVRRLEIQVEGLTIQMEALVAANGILTSILRQAQEMYQPEPTNISGITKDSRAYFVPGAQPPTDREIQLEPSDSWYPVMHIFQEEDSPTGCGRVAYFVTRQIVLGEKFDPTIMRVQRSEGFWGPPEVTEVPRCSGCHVPIDPRSPADLDFSQARTLPQAAPEQRTRKPKVNTRRTRPAQEVRVSQPLARPGGDSSPGPSDPPPEPTLSAPFTPEARSDVVNDLNQLAREMGLHG